jgi:hypothetical protein
MRQLRAMDAPVTYHGVAEKARTSFPCEFVFHQVVAVCLSTGMHFTGTVRTCTIPAKYSYCIYVCRTTYSTSTYPTVRYRTTYLRAEAGQTHKYRNTQHCCRANLLDDFVIIAHDGYLFVSWGRDRLALSDALKCGGRSADRRLRCSSFVVASEGFAF